MAFTVFPATQKELPAKSKVKTMLIAFFDSNGIIHKESVPAGQTVNSAFYEEVLKRLLRRIHRVQPELRRTGQWMFLHDNAPAHCAIRVHRFLAQRGVPVLDHPPYSPDLAPADFFLFPRLKCIMKGPCFTDVAAIQECVTAVL
jgi:histone-lysine N-methyltransferase SETMAR